jgi:hypothetical protein
MSLETEIQAAFADGIRPADEELFEMDSEGALEALRDRTWTEVSPAEADYHSFALLAFAPAGFAYFLPAFLLAAVRREDLGVSDAVVDCLSPPKGNPTRPSFARRWERLSQNQKVVCVRVLRHFERRNPHAVGTAIAALETTIQ